MKATKKTISILLALALLVSIIPLSAVTANAAPDNYEDITLNKAKTVNDDFAVFRFKPKESGWYSVSTSGMDEDVVCYLYLYDSDYDEDYCLADDYANSNTESCLSYYYDGGDTYYIEIMSYYDFDYVPFSVALTEMVPATGVSFREGTSGSGYVGSYLYLNPVFTPDNAIYEEGEWTSSKESVAEVDYFGEIYCIAPGTTTITYTTENDLTAKFQLTVRKIPAISAGEKKTVNITYDGETAFFSFTPKESGYYRYYSDVDLWAEGQILDSNRESLASSSGFDLRYQMTAGTTYYLTAGFEIFDEPVSFTVGIEKMISAKSVVITYPEDDSYIAYKGTSEGFYAELSPEDCAPEDFTWKTSDKKVAAVDEYGTVSFVGAGSATITVTTEKGLTAKRKVTVVEPEVIRLNETKTVNLKGGDDESVCLFTPKTDGYYELIAENYEDPLEILVMTDNSFLSSDTRWSDSDGTLHANYYLTSNESYFIKSNSISAVSFRLTIKNALKPASVTVEGGKPVKGLVGDSLYLSIEYSPEHSVDNIKSAVSDKPKIAAVDENCPEQIWFLSRGTAHITYTTEGGLKATCTVNVLDVDDIDELKLGKAAEVTDISSDNYAYFRFTPSTSGAYLFTSSDNNGERISAEMKKVDGEYNYNGDLDDNNNFFIKEKLTAGTTYILRVDSYSSKPTSCKIKVEKTRAISSLELVSPPKQTTFIPNLYESVDFTGLSVRLRWDDGTSTVWTYNPDYNLDNDWIEYDYIEYGVDEEEGLLTVNYNNKKVKYQLTQIENPVDHIVVNTAPTRVYIYGEYPYFNSYSAKDSPVYYLSSPDLSGLVFTVYYKNGTNKRYSWQDMARRDIVSNRIMSYEADGYPVLAYPDSPAVVGNNTLTLQYMNNTATYTAKVDPSPVKSIEIVKGPDNPVYNANYGMPDLYGLKLRLHNTDGSSKDVVISNYAPYRYDFEIDGHRGVIYRIIGTSYKLDYLGCACTGYDLKPFSKEVSAIHVTDLDQETGKITMMLTYADDTVKTLQIDDIINSFVSGSTHHFFGRTPDGIFSYYYSENPDGSLIVRAFACIDVYASSEPSKQYLLGDADGDGDVTILDATRIQRFLAELTTDDDGTIRRCGDADCDGDVTIIDATAIQRFLADMKVDYPIGQLIA